MKSLIAYAHETYSEEAAYHVFGGMPMRDVQALLLFYKPAFRRQTQLQALQETCIFFISVCKSILGFPGNYYLLKCSSLSVDDTGYVYSVVKFH